MFTSQAKQRNYNCLETGCVCVRVCECQSKEDVWCRDGVLQNRTSVCVWMVLHRRAEWKENDTLCGVKSRKYLKRRKTKKKKKAAIVLKTSQSTRDQPGGRKQYVTFREEEKKKVPFNFQQGLCCVEPGVDCANVFVLPHGKHFSVPVFKKKPKPVIHQRTTCKMS